MLRLSVGLIVLLMTGAAQAAEAVPFGPAVVQLSGRLLVDYSMSRGGMSKALLLWLEEPIAVGTGASGEPRRIANVDRVKLAPAPDVDLESQIGASVTVQGTLVSETSDEHHTKVTMRVARLVASEKAADGAVGSIRAQP